MADGVKISLDTQGFDQMVKHLMKKTGASYASTINKTTAAILTGAANKTKMTSARSIKNTIDKRLRRPFDDSEAVIHKTKDGKIWYRGKDWEGKDRWALMHTGIKPGANIKRAPKTITRTGKDVRVAKVGSKMKARYDALARKATEYIVKEKAYRKKVTGLGKASWLYLLKILNIPIPMVGNASKYVNVPLGKAKMALKAKKEGTGKSDYAVVISSKVQAALNRKAKGIFAFENSFNGQIKSYKRQVGKDLKTWTKDFAKRYGFTV